MIGETVNIRVKMREAGGQGAGGPVFGFQAATGLVIPTHTHPQGVPMSTKERSNRFGEK